MSIMNSINTTSRRVRQTFCKLNKFRATRYFYFLNVDKKNIREWKDRNIINTEICKRSISLGLYYCSLYKWGYQTSDTIAE